MTDLAADLTDHLPHWTDVYRDLHAHPELGFAEHRTAATIVRELTATGGWEVTGRVGGTGVVAVLRNGPGPTTWLRADMDALPVTEETGLAYASAEPGRMHACGHDVHVSALLGACRQFAAHPGAWAGTLVAIFQPAEEIGQGARAMLADGVLERFPRPDLVLGQHVGPFPAGLTATRPGPLMAAADSLRITLYGAGAHASTPQFAVDPIVAAAALVLRLQTFSARQAPVSPATVLTVGAIHAGTVPNVIPHTAELLASLRTFDTGAREKALAEIRRIVRAEAQAQGATREPGLEVYDSFPLTVNTPAATARVAAALNAQPLPAPLAASEDFGAFGTAAGCSSVFFHFGGADPAAFSPDALAGVLRGALPAEVATNHSPRFAPSDRLAVPAGIRHLLTVVAALHAGQEPTPG
ncbi:amidohydrolase [Actinoplanes sp. DH11]|uniref:amidohydrolase n=1 Tax=Actinoplanes sp. DH11 TaxID=2857011 RepID=UPI001E5BB29D|nr:amidohydrolase [Actinoplanes sp. DH11]